MPKTKVPSNSLLLTQFSKFRVKPRRHDSDQFQLIAQGDELNTVWFQDRPLRGYGHFSFDDITGRSTWNKVFNGDRPNSVLTGEGRSLVFETGYFKAKENGTYRSKIKFIGDQASQDVITGKWKRSSLLIDSTGEPDDNSDTLVEGLAGLLVVGGGLALYKKIRASRVAEAAEQAIEDANEDIAQAQKDLDKLQDEYDSLQEDVSNAIQDLEDAQINLREAKGDLATWEELLSKAKTDEEILECRQKIDALQREIMGYLRNIPDLSNQVEKLELSLQDSERAVLQAETRLNDVKNGLNAAKQLEEAAFDELQASLDDISAEDNLYDSDAFRENQALIEADEVNEVKLLDEMIQENNNEYAKGLLQDLRNSLGDGYNQSIEKSLGKIIEDGADNAYSAFAEATCNPLSVSGGSAKHRHGKSGKLGKGGKKTVGSPVCTDIEGIDPIMDVYAEEFTIEENMIFKGSHIFTELRTDLANIGYEAEVGELVEFVAGPEFAGEAGGLIGAFTEGTLVAEEAVGALDIASIGLGGEAFVDGLALEVGGDALLGEIALDLLEIAAFF